MDAQLIGLALAGEMESSSTHVVGALCRPPADQKLSDFRTTVSSALPLRFSTKPYIFLTANGWAINESLEHTVTASSAITTDGLVRIQLQYPMSRVGILIDGNPAIPIGFVFCNLDSTILHLMKEIQRQLPAIGPSLISRNVCFVDRNGWPVGKDQECSLAVLDIIRDSTVRVRASLMQGLPGSDQAQNLPLLPPVSAPLSFPSVSDFLATNGRPSDLPAIEETQEMAVLEQSLGSENYFDSMKLASRSDSSQYEILISYVHSEASDYATLLMEAFEDQGYKVFLDTFCIQGGTDWQDALNSAITNCALFVPLITSQYGETLWTNREVKLADILGKIIIPVNYLPTWPPKCLAIQFATTQYIGWKKTGAAAAGNDSDEEQEATSVASEIVNRYKAELGTPSTKQLEVAEKTPASPPISALMRKASSMKSYAGVLPQFLPAVYRKSVQESRQGRPLIVVSSHSAQNEFVQGIVSELESKGYEAWCSHSVDTFDSEKERLTFQGKADEAGVVIFVISNEFANSSFCQQQVYYCEQRKRIVPLLCDAIRLPHWLSMLIGTNPFIDCRAARYKSTMIERIEVALNPMKAEQDLKELLKQKAQVTQMCSELSAKLPRGINVYISGGTKFFSACGENICKELGMQLAQYPEINLITGGFFGVGDTVAHSFYDERLKLNLPHGVCHVVAVRDDQDRSLQTHQNPDGTFPPIAYGDTLFFGDSVRQREMLTPRVVDLCILIEGGPGAAFEAQQFSWNGNQVIPVKVTGGAAGGSFDVPKSIFNCPLHVSESDWSSLSNTELLPRKIATAVVRIVRALKLSPPTPRLKRKNTELFQKLNSRVKRSDTLPADDSLSTSQLMRRTYSES